jgi:hypothetical protein
MAPNINMRTFGKSDEQIEEEGKVYEKTFMDYKNDVYARLQIKPGTFFRATIKKNIAKFNPSHSVKINDEMTSLAGQAETFEVIKSEKSREGIVAIGFGWKWHLDWLENFLILGQKP